MDIIQSDADLVCILLGERLGDVEILSREKLIEIAFHQFKGQAEYPILFLTGSNNLTTPAHDPKELTTAPGTNPQYSCADSETAIL